MKIPCENCLLVPRCRHKEYSLLFNECKLIVSVMYTHGFADSRYRNHAWERNVIYLEKILRPTKWKTDSVGQGSSYNIAILGRPWVEN